MNPKNKLDIKDKLKAHTVAELLNEISQANLSGSLRASQDKSKAVVYFKKGEVVFAVSNAREHRLFEILLREDAIKEKELVAIEGFTKDLHLAKTLRESDAYSVEAVDGLVSFQIAQILQTIVTWNKGSWVFSPLARIKEGIDFKINLSSILFEYGNRINSSQVIARFQDTDESFSLNITENMTQSVTPNADQSYILSRIGGDSRTIDEIVSLSNFTKEDVLKNLYPVWLSGMVSRKNWNANIKEKDISKIGELKLNLKTSAVSFEEALAKEKLKKEKEEAKKAKEEAQETKEKEDIQKLTVEKYLRRVENAVTHYEIFGVDPKAEVKKIKKVYFTLAKSFHPDLYHRQVDKDSQKRIQNAFTEIAKAYETLKSEKARELYDFRLRKVIEKHKGTSGDSPSSTKDTLKSQKNAESAVNEFESGHKLLQKKEHEKATPFLARAVRLDDEVARYHAFYGKALSFDKKKRHEAESEIQTAIKIEPKSIEFRLMLIQLFAQIGLVARAKGEINKLLKFAPNNQEARSLLDSLNKKN